MKSKTLISKQAKGKSNNILFKTILEAKRNEGWLEVSSILAGPRRNWKNVNLEEIEKKAEGKKILVPGKVLSQGDLNKKVKVIALRFSEKAKEKLLNSKIDFCTIDEEIKSNPSGEGIQILK